MAKDFPNFRNKDVVAIRGATISKMIDYVNKNQQTLAQYKIIVLHVGTNHFSDKTEWFLYKDYANGKVSKETFNFKLGQLNPPPALGTASQFKESYQRLISLIIENTSAKLLLSAILPRFWDQDRRHLVRKIYNEIIKKMEDKNRVFFITSYRPFFNQNRNLRSELFQKDGLHLNSLGTSVFSAYICDRIQRCIRGELK